jgi:hypothetical protein
LNLNDLLAVGGQSHDLKSVKRNTNKTVKWNNVHQRAISSQNVMNNLETESTPGHRQYSECLIWCVIID